jgi:hypothetical protein
MLGHIIRPDCWCYVKYMIRISRIYISLISLEAIQAAVYGLSGAAMHLYEKSRR